MPNSKELTDQELDEFRELLLVKKRAILGQLDQMTKTNLNQSQRDSSGDLSGYTYHLADVATDNYDREFNLGLAGNEQQFLNVIEQALTRIEEKAYGLCATCEHPISKKRLTAVPYATQCIRCQEAEEKKSKGLL